jgi:nitroreductase
MKEMMRQIVVLLLPKQLRVALRGLREKRRLRRCVRYDERHYVRHGGMLQSDLFVQQIKLVQHVHTLEKGLALAEPRPGFGQTLIAYLLATVPRYVALAGIDQTVLMVHGVLGEYLAFHRKQNMVAPREAEITGLLRQLAEACAQGMCVPSPTIEQSREEIWRAARIDFEAFVKGRHSIRQFSSEPVSAEAISKAVRWAQQTPSSCNRQPARVHVFSRAEDKEKILKLQGGSRGFGHLASHVLAVTADLRCFINPKERHQAWIDGGMFAMSLVYALHALGYGSCCLHWAVDTETDIAMRRVTGILDHEEIIMLLAVGSLPPRLKVAASGRRPVEDILTFHEGA